MRRRRKTSSTKSSASPVRRPPSTNGCWPARLDAGTDPAAHRRAIAGGTKNRPRPFCALDGRRAGGARPADGPDFSAGFEGFSLGTHLGVSPELVTSRNPAMCYAMIVGSSDSNEKFKCVVLIEAGVVSGLFSFPPSGCNIPQLPSPDFRFFVVFGGIRMSGACSASSTAAGLTPSRCVWRIGGETPLHPEAGRLRYGFGRHHHYPVCQAAVRFPFHRKQRRTRFSVRP